MNCYWTKERVFWVYKAPEHGLLFEGRAMTKQGADETGRARRFYCYRQGGSDFMNEYGIVWSVVGQHPHDSANEEHMNG